MKVAPDPGEPLFDTIRHRMRREGITQRDLAQRIGLSETQLSKMLKGRVGISLARLRHILTALDLELHAITPEESPALAAAGPSRVAVTLVGGPLAGKTYEVTHKCRAVRVKSFTHQEYAPERPGDLDWYWRAIG